MTRLTTRILSFTMAACMGLGAVAVQAQPRNDSGYGQQDRHHDDRRGPDRSDYRNDQRHDRSDYRHDRNDYRNDRRDDRHDDFRGAGPDHRWMRGSRVPPEYRGYNYVVNDWRGHRLSAPPRGYHWIQNGGDYLLVAIATGVIASIVLGGGY